MSRKLLVFGLVVALVLFGTSALKAADRPGTVRTPTVNPTKEPEATFIPNRTPQPVGTPVRISPIPSFEPKESPVSMSKKCSAILSSIKTRSENLNKYAANMLAKFDAILLSVQNYYTGTVVPSGKTVPNYQSLVNDTQTKRTAVQTALSDTTNDLAGLSCTDLKSTITKYNKDMRVAKDSLAAYRTSIQKLIVAVHGFQKAVRPTFSPRATFLPRESGKPTPKTSAIPFFSPKPVRSIGPDRNPF